MPLLRHAGLSVTPLMTYPCRLDYTGLSPATLRSSLDLWWLLHGGVCNPRGKPESSCLLPTFPTQWSLRWQRPLPTARRAKHFDCQVAARVATYRRVEWAIDPFALYKRLSMDGIYTSLLQERRRIVVPNLVRIFHACLATGHVPAIWSQVKVVFTLKPSKNSYSGPTDFRPISLTSFLLNL